MGESRVVIPIFGILDVTGEVIGMWVVLAAVAVISLLATRHMREKPGRFQNVIETATFPVFSAGRSRGSTFCFLARSSSLSFSATTPD